MGIYNSAASGLEKTQTPKATPGLNAHQQVDIIVGGEPMIIIINTSAVSWDGMLRSPSVWEPQQKKRDC